MRCSLVMGPILLLLAASLPASFGAGFGDIPGDYCKIRQPVQCCTERNDDCTMPILGNHRCYCDMFCRRPDSDNGDCCPDFKYVCENQPPVIQRGMCEYEGQKYPAGTTTKQNCNTCTCVNTAQGDRWNCGNPQPCLINSEALDNLNNGRNSWTGDKHSQFWGRSLAEGIQYRLGTLAPENTVASMSPILIKPANLATSFDSRERWPGWISAVRNQNNCSSSWAFSTTALASDRLAIMSEGKTVVTLAPQQLLDCNQHASLAANTCEGGFLDRAWWYIRKIGILKEECYPYISGGTDAPNPYCKATKAMMTSGNVKCVALDNSPTKPIKLTPPYRISENVEDIMMEIQENGPVQATFKVHEDFFMYKSGVYQHKTGLSSDPNWKASQYHSVRIVGWGVDRSTGPSIDYWICANSWGTDWGENGYFKILKGENHCEIESFVITALGKAEKKRRRRFHVRRQKLKRLRSLRRL